MYIYIHVCVDACTYVWIHGLKNTGRNTPGAHDLRAPQRGNNAKNVCVCVLCVTLMFRRIHIPEAEVLSVRFPKEYDHINVVAKHPKLCTYFIQNSGVQSIYPCIDPYMHPHIHACMHIHEEVSAWLRNAAGAIKNNKTWRNLRDMFKIASPKIISPQFLR